MFYKAIKKKWHVFMDHGVVVKWQIKQSDSFRND